MAKPISIQKQLRDNADDLHNFVRDLKLWEEEMKRKDRQLNTHQISEETLPPVRRAKLSYKKEVECENNKKRICSYDYKSWDTYDVEKACEDLDSEHVGKTVLDEEAAKENEKYLKEKALYEKEIGNQHVKASKWNSALEAYSRAINAYPKDPIFYANRALCYLKNKKWAEVEADCTAALRLDSTYVKALLRRAMACEALGRLEDSRHDLRQVLMLEPGNSQALQRLKALEEEKKKDCKGSLTKLASSLVVDSQKVSTSSSPLSVIQSEKISFIQDDSKTPVKPSSEPNWENNSSKIQAISKPPHLCSKKSLKQIEIYDIGFGVPKHNCSRKIFSLTTDKDNSLDFKLLNPAEASSDANLQTPLTLSGTKSIPPPPKTYVQFHTSWSCIKNNSNLCYKFLKQIPGETLADIFKESLESEMLSSIIETLATEFSCDEGRPVLPYLQGLAATKRFSTLALFLTPSDKTNLIKLFEYCIIQGECSPCDIENLREMFEM